VIWLDIYSHPKPEADEESNTLHRFGVHHAQAPWELSQWDCLGNDRYFVRLCRDFLNTCALRHANDQVAVIEFAFRERAYAAAERFTQLSDNSRLRNPECDAGK
jgi:hypothetical protein